MHVSILILMDIALKASELYSCRVFVPGFNPYSDGYCSESPEKMPDAGGCQTRFNPYSDGYCSERMARALWRIVPGYVSILILMDIALKGTLAMRAIWMIVCFNPYSDGYCSESYATSNQGTFSGVSFNPYSDGYCSESLCPSGQRLRATLVSILILMDIALKECEPLFYGPDTRVSILILMDIALKAYYPWCNQRDADVSILILMDIALKVR